jgi:hypothetical protein
VPGLLITTSSPTAADRRSATEPCTGRPPSGNLLNSQVLEPPAHDAGAERARSASNHPFRHSRPMLGAEVFGRSQNRTCCRIESFTESPVISRGVIGTSGESSGNRHWGYSNHADIRPELVRILHLLFSSPMGLEETAPVRAATSSITASTRQYHSQYAASAGTLLHFVVFTLRVEHCAEHHSSAADPQAPARTAHK